MKLPHGWLFIPKATNKGTAIEVEGAELIWCCECKYYEPDITANPWGVCCHPDWVVGNVGHEVDETGWCYRAEPWRGEEHEDD